MTNPRTYKIVGSPSREALFDALRLRHEERREIFTVELPREDHQVSSPGKLKLTVMVTDIGYPGLTGLPGTCWNFKAIDEHAMLGWLYLEGYIDLHKRVGWLRERGSN